MMYVVTNEFDELIRLVHANSPEEAIAKAKASLSPQELTDAGERQVQSWRSIKETWEKIVDDSNKHNEWCKQNNMKTRPPMVNPYADLDPETCREIDLDEYNWQVLQEVDPEREITILEDLCI